jgi:hypothetical protein
MNLSRLANSSACGRLRRPIVLAFLNFQGYSYTVEILYETRTAQLTLIAATKASSVKSLSPWQA